MAVVVRVREVQAASRVEACVVGVVAVVTNRHCTLTPTGMSDTIGVHVTVDADLEEHVALPLVAHWDLRAHRVPVAVMAVPPAVGSAGVEQRAGVMAASVPEHSGCDTDREVKMAVVVRVREVQATSRVEACVVSIVAVVTHRHCALTPTGMSDTIGVHVTVDADLPM